MGLLKEFSLLIGYLSTLIVILGGIRKALVRIVREFHRWLDFRESRVQARQRVAVKKPPAEGFLEGHSYCLAWAFAFAAVFIFYVLVKSTPQAQA